jgi:hypothetical protein
MKRKKQLNPIKDMDVLNKIANLLICCSAIALVATLFGRSNRYTTKYKTASMFLKLALCIVACGSLWSLTLPTILDMPSTLTNIGTGFILCWLAYYKYTNINKL